MQKIITLTVNPAIDKSTMVDRIVPNNKLRCAAPRYDAGGGGINVSRAIKKLGGSSLCIYLAGGPSGDFLKSLLDEEKIDQKVIVTEACTRENLSVTDSFCDQQYRFGMPGSHVNDAEWKEVLKVLEVTLSEGDYLVASGSLTSGIPDDFYHRVALLTEKTKSKLILDTSGEPLIQGVKEGIFLLKPNLSELSALCGVTSISTLNLERLAKQFLKENAIEVMVISMGASGVMLISNDQIEHIPAPVVLQKSTIGAGDSMVAGMVLSLSMGKTLSEMARYGVAAGTAATIKQGTQLCEKENVEQLLEWIEAHTEGMSVSTL
ncbi:MAG: 1-phosphofructokinase family hexose kinase [Cyclobacteriaceae bacterium]